MKLIAYVVKHENAISEEARAAGVIRDAVLVRVGTSHHKDEIQQEVRLVVVKATGEDGQPYELWLLTDRLHMPAELVAMAYRYRWTIELFFRWLKSIVGIRHLLSDHQNGVTMQLYAALIASLLIVLWTGLKVSKRTWEMVQHYLAGWATAAELERHLSKEKERQTRAAEKKSDIGEVGLVRAACDRPYRRCAPSRPISLIQPPQQGANLPREPQYPSQNRPRTGQAKEQHPVCRTTLH